MKDSQTFILNIRSNTDTNGYYYLTINIPELTKYRNIKACFKDVLIISETLISASTKISGNFFTLCSDTFLFENSYESNKTNKMESGCNVIATLPINYPYYIEKCEYLPVAKVNGNHRFWISDFNQTAPNKDTDFFVTIVVTAYN